MEFLKKKKAGATRYFLVKSRKQLDETRAQLVLMKAHLNEVKALEDQISAAMSPISQRQLAKQLIMLRREAMHHSWYTDPRSLEDRIHRIKVRCERLNRLLYTLQEPAHS